MHLSNRVKNLPASATIQMAALARKLKSEGKDIINLSLGEPDFDTPIHIQHAGKQAIDDGYSKYTAVNGMVELRQAIVNKFKRDNNLDFTVEDIVVSTGAKQSIANVVLSLVDEGDEVLLPAPYWVSYAAIIQLAEATMVPVTTSIENDFKITPEELEAAITPKTRLMIFSSPCNPTGSVYSKDELEAIARVVAKYPDLYIISDEIYEFINFMDAHYSIASFDFIKDRVITVNGVSKGFAMTGWRLGYIAAPSWIAKACTKMQGQFTSGTSAISQKAAEEALSADLAPTFAMKDAFNKRRGIIVKMLKEIDGMKVNEPEGAFYVFPDVSAFFGKSFEGRKINNATELAMYILEEANVSIVTGEAFGAPNCMRISYAASDESIIEAVKRIKTALENLN